MTWSQSQQRRLQADRKARRDKYIWGPFFFVLGWFASLIFNQWITPLLPGPRADVILGGLSVTSGNASGCTVYTAELFSDEEIDAAYVKIAFPQNIKGAQVGYSGQGVSAVAQELNMQAWEVGRNPGGECALVQAAVNINEGVSSVVTANVITIRTSKMAAKTPVMGMVVVPTHDVAMNSNNPIFEGNYEYTKWGLTVRRPLKFQYIGTSPAK
jgi:hypothetical protein